MDEQLCPDYFPRALYNLIHFHPEWFDGGPGQPGRIFDELNRIYAGLAITVLARTLGADAARQIDKTLGSVGVLHVGRLEVGV